MKKQLLLLACITSFATFCSAQCTALYNYSANPTSGVVTFTDLSGSGTGSIIDYSWTFGDGGSSITASPGHTYVYNGDYLVCLHIATDSGCGNTYCDVVHVSNALPCPSITAAWTSSSIADSAFFTSTDTSSLLMHTWYFGDGGTSSSANPAHFYIGSAALYYVCHMVKVPGSNCTDTSCSQIQITGTCQAGFTHSYQSTIYGVDFHNTSSSSGIVTRYSWSFGDGDTSAAQNPGHIYADYGDYYVCLTIETGDSCSSTWCDTVHLLNPDSCAGLTAAFHYTTGNSPVGSTYFTSDDTSGDMQHLWYFGDGSTSTSANPTHVYSGGSTVLYYVCHVVTISGTNCTDSTCMTIINDTCAAHYYWNNTSTPFGIHFANASTSPDSAITYHWDFGDGDTSTVINPDHIYPDSNYYVACLTMSTNTGCSNTICDTVHPSATDPCQGLSAAYTYTLSGDSVYFQNLNADSNATNLWYFGDGTTSTATDPIHFYAGTTVLIYACHIVTVPGAGCSDTVCQTITNPIYNDTVCGTVFYDLNSNGIMDGSEQGVSNATITYPLGTVTTDSNGHYTLLVDSGLCFVYYCAPTSYAFTMPIISSGYGNNNCTTYDVPVTQHQHLCGYDFGIEFNNINICGTVYFDANNNGIQDGGENGMPGIAVTITDSTGSVHYVTTDATGHYCYSGITGTYVIAAANAYNGTNATGNIYLNANTPGSTYTNNNFGEYATAGTCDLGIEILPMANETYQYYNYYRVYVCNTGTTTTNGNFTLHYDAPFAFSHYVNLGSPTPSVNTGTNTISGLTGTLAPGACAQYEFIFFMSGTLSNGTEVLMLASVDSVACTDGNLSNQHDTTRLPYLGHSFDPNNKAAIPAGVGAPGYIQATQELKYVINFQNTGTAPAVNIVVRDVIDPNLDLSSFKMLQASHNYSMQCNGREAVWKFSNIMLPDSGTDQDASHGFVSFAIKPLSNLYEGSQIQNTGYIYFDYNQPVATNSTLNTITYKLSIDDIETNNAVITLYPNPFGARTIIKITDGTPNIPYQLQVYDMLGRVLRTYSTTNNEFTIERGNLAAGVYMFEIRQNNKVIGTGKMIAQ